MKNRITKVFPSLPFSSSFLTFIFPFSSFFSRLPLSYLLLPFLTLFATQVATAQVPSNGLVGYWPFNGNANDESGNGNNGTVNGATLTTDRFGNANSAYSFDGVNDFIQYSSGSATSLNVLGDFSISFWLKTSSTGSSSRTIISFGDQLNNNSGGVTIGINDGITQAPYGRLGYATQAQWRQSTNTINDNTWHFVVITLQGSVFTLHIDNVLNNQSTNQLPALSWNGSRRIGAGNYAMIGFYKDLLDDIGMYNRALTPAEITQLYTDQTSLVEVPCTPFLGEDQTVCAGTSVTLSAGGSSLACPTLPSTLQNGLVGYWPFCGNANDESGNGNNGTVNGATLTTDRFGNANSAYSFDGVNDRISISHNQALSPSIVTVSLWFNASTFLNTDGNQSQLVSKREFSGWGSAYELGIGKMPPEYLNSSTNTLYTNYTISNNNYTKHYSSSGLTVNDWHQAAYSHDGQYVKFYIDGILVYETPSNGELSDPGQLPLWFGGRPGGIGRSFYNGLLDEIAIYNRVLNAAEIQQLYNLGQSTYLWSTGATTATINVTPSTTTTYTCTVTDANGNVCTDSVTIFVPQIEATDLTICTGETTTLYVSGINSANTSCLALPTNLQTGLVGYWPFCGNANDASGNENHMSNNGAVLTTDRFGNVGQSYVFNGAQWMQSSSSQFNGLNQFSMGFWCKSNFLNNNTEYIIHKGCENPTSQGVSFRMSKSDVLWGDNWTNSNGRVWCNSTQAADVSWHHMVMSYNNQSLAIYIDGVLNAQSNQFGDLSTNSSPLYLATKVADAGCNKAFFYNGKLDDVTLHNRVLTAAEIQQLYTLGQTAYLWSTGATTPTINVSPTTTTTYTCTVTSNGVSCTDAVTVVVSNPVIDLGADVTACGTSTTLTAPAGYDSYVWSNGGTTNTTTVTANGTYTCTVTQGGCSASDAVDVMVIDATISATDSVLCAGQSTTLSVNAIPSATYNSVLFPNQIEFNGHFYSKYTGTANWFNAKSICESNGGYLAIPNSIAETDFIRNLSGVEQAGYAFTWMGMTDEIAEGTWIDVLGNPVTFSYWASGEPNNQNNEDFGLIYSQASGLGLWNDGHSMHLLPFVMERNSMPLEILWSNGATTPSINVSPTATTTYTCTVTINGVSCTDDITVIVSQPVASITPNGIVEICQGQSIALTANGGVSYLWNTGAPTQSITVNTEAVYSVTVTDANGCTDTESQLVKVNFLPNIGVNNASICSGQSATLTATGGLSYAWSPATGLSTTTGTTVTASPATSTVYSVTGTGANGCTNTATATVTVNTLPTSTITAATATTFCQGGNVVLNANAGAGLSYQWFNNATEINGAISSTYTATMSGSYTVTVTNASTCSATSTAVDVTTVANVNYFADADGDGFGDITTLISTCIQTQGYVTNSSDCNDNDAAIFPGAMEICNDIDDDCNELIDDGLVFTTYYADADGDSFGDINNPLDACMMPDGYVTNNTDCNDNSANQNAASAEICNGEDDDCDGAIDNGLIFLDFYSDIDGDGFGAGNVTSSCADLGAGYTNNNTDCDDTNSNTNPSATETCNTIDDNCDGQTDDGTLTVFFIDNDGDTYGNPSVSILACTQPIGYTPDDTDCNDTDANINPGAEDIGGNGIDENCDGQIDNSIFELNASINLFPNPTHSELNIQINNALVGNEMFIFDAVGKMVFKQKLLSTQTTVSVSNLADGNYIVRVGEMVKRFEVMK